MNVGPEQAALIVTSFVDYIHGENFDVQPRAGAAPVWKPLYCFSALVQMIWSCWLHRVRTSNQHLSDLQPECEAALAENQQVQSHGSQP